MYIKFKKNYQQLLMKKALKKAGSERKLSKLVKIPAGSINQYKTGLRLMPRFRIIRILRFLKIPKRKIEKFIDKELPDNWRQVKGGKKLIKIMKRTGRFEKMIKRITKESGKKLREWHIKMKKTNEKEYYLTQYKRFRKIAEYKFKTKKGEKVRNILEQKIANYLKKQKINYLYEPFINANGKVYFPDFRCGKLIIECTMWRGYEKAYLLKCKIKNLEGAGFKVLVVLPSNLKNFYKPIEKYIISDINKIKGVYASVAQFSS